jgi:hypothetical protein
VYVDINYIERRSSIQNRIRSTRLESTCTRDSEIMYANILSYFSDINNRLLRTDSRLSDYVTVLQYIDGRIASSYDSSDTQTK